METEKCLCGAMVNNVTDQSLRSFLEPHVIRGCKACRYTGTKPVNGPKAIIINVSNNDNGSKG